MKQQQANPRKPVILAVLMLVFAAAMFSVAFFLLDGMTLVNDFLATDPPVIGANGDTDIVDSVIPDKSDTSDASVVATETLQLPEGMTREFALRLWQEQIDSQSNIRKLVDGEVVSFALGDVAQGSELATIPISAEFKDGTSAPGEFVLRKVGDMWYTAFIGGLRRVETGGSADSVHSADSAVPPTPLPDVTDIDVEVLNTLIAQQRESQAVLEEYANGLIKHVEVIDVTQGAGTRTINIQMTETHETSSAAVVCLSREISGETFWFVARFTKL